MLKIDWRPYQDEYFDTVQKAMNKKIRRNLIVMATGTGKRLLAVGTSKLFEGRSLFLCHTEELIQQAFNDFSKMYPMDVGIVKGKAFDINKKIVIASAQTIWRRLDKIPEDWFECVMADEVHHYLARTYIMPLEHFKSEYMFGYTATPTRLDGLNFSQIVDQITYEYSIENAINDEFLCPLEAYRIKTDIDISKVKKVGGDFNKKELSSVVDIPARNRLIYEKYVQYGQRRQGVAFCASIKHAHNVAKVFSDNGVSSATISNKTDPDERKAINRLYKNGDIQILTNVNILTEGWDYSDVGIVMQARPTQSLALYMQMLGRGTRLKSAEYIEQFNRRDCTILDFVDNTGNHKLVNHWTIEAEKEIEDRVLISEEQKEIYIEKITKARQARIQRQYQHDKELDLISMPKKKRVVHYGRMSEPATVKQLGWLKSEGVWEEGREYTKGEASEFITNMPAKPWMLRDLQNWNYNYKKVRGGVTVGQYYEVKKSLPPKN